ncbi:SAM-dependent methyltransferase [Kineosporia sp. J2-2]|uniref:SAM-dependent methyltransferase n=1 Tax=Kineosporia corallincola TaxID=2835133 RepID=A0ABS5T8U3_9ACTN|nr:SAM-dependent methyltransferase [Kineosporia corallincola]MBT0767495.1 SAM-dependent methyltransferase [Kineosporia corallincola]
MPEPLVPALDRLRPLLLDADGLVRAVASGRRRNQHPDPSRAELRPVDLKQGRQIQVTTTDGRIPVVRNLTGEAAGQGIDALLAQPFGNWHVETRDSIVQLRVTKRGEAQVHVEARSAERVDGSHDRPPNHLIDPDDPLFRILGADAAKRRQVDAFLRQLAPIARRVKPEGRSLRVVDLGCGNAYLTMAAHRYLAAEVDPDVQTLGVDIRPEMAERNARVAAEAGLTGLGFRAASIEQAAADPEFTGVDIVLALHACDTATDDSLALAVRWRAQGVLAAPCCHHDIQRQLTEAETVPFGGLTRHPILRERFADVLTDTARADLLRLLGYRVEVVEFIDSRHTPRNALIRAVHTGTAPTARRVAEYTDLVSSWHVDPALAQRLRPEVDAVLGSV